MRTSLSVPTVPISDKYGTKIYAAKSIFAIHDKKDFKNHVTSCNVYKHIENHCKVNFRQYAISDISESLTDYDYNKDELFTVIKHALSLDQSLHSNIYADMSIINKNMNHRLIIFRSCTFLRKKKFSKL